MQGLQPDCDPKSLVILGNFGLDSIPFKFGVYLKNNLEGFENSCWVKDELSKNLWSTVKMSLVLNYPGKYLATHFES